MTHIINSEDVGFSYSSEEVVFTRKVLLEGDTLMDIYKSKLLPQKGARHPHNTSLRLTSCECSPIGNQGNKKQAIATLSYSSIYNEDTTEDPWKLGAQSVSVTFNTESVPFIYGYNQNGQRIQLLNSAGCKITAETSRFIKAVSFMYCVKAKSKGDAPVNDYPVINASSVKVAGFSIPALQGMLMPMSANYVTEYDETTGDVLREYWEVTATVQINKKGWAKRLLDVGTMAKFPDEDSSGLPKPIYQYTPWKSKNDAENVSVRPVFGSINAVVKAKNEYAKLFTGDEQQKRWDSLPYQEITEPMPLNNGELYHQALYNPANTPYKEIVVYESNPESWAKWNLPRKRS